MRQILLLGLNDLRLTLSDRPALIWLLVLPITMMWFFSFAGTDRSATPRIGLDVVDRDGGRLAQTFLGQLEDEPVSVNRVAGDADESGPRTLIIPEGFTSGVLAGEPQTLRLEHRTGANPGLSGVAQWHVDRAIARTLARVAGMDAAVKPPARLVVSAAGAGRPVPSGSAQSVPGMLTFMVLMMTLIYGAVFLTIEKRTGMLRRQAVLPIGRLRIFLGKLLGRLLIATLQIAALVLAGRFLFGVSWGRSPLGLALMLASYAVAVAALSTLLGALLRTSEQASAVGWITGMVLAALGGCWWPVEIMPGWVRSFALLLPTSWAMDGFHALISFGRGVDGVWRPALMLLLFGALFAVLGARWLRFEA